MQENFRNTKGWLTVLKKSTLCFSCLILALIGFFLGIRYQLGNDTRTINDLIKRANDNPGKVIYLDKPVSDQKGTLETYYSRKLGIIFSYFQPEGSKFPIKIKEDGNKIYLYVEHTPSDPNSYISGKFIQIFSKDQKRSLTDTITENFLSGYSQDNCEVKITQMSKNYTMYSPDFEYAQIRVRNITPETTYLEGQEKADLCPPEYVVFQGSRYFVMDKNHPDRFAFVSLGQDNILSYPDLTWDMTIRFLD